MKSYRSYIICGTPRSGSTLLCYLLEHAGCGQPDSYFRRQSILGLARDLGVSHDGDLNTADFSRRYVNAVIEEGHGGTDIFGLRVMYENLHEMCERLGQIDPEPMEAPQLIERAFGHPLYIYLSRADKVAQAISLLKAEQSGLWHISSDGSELERTARHREPVYSADRISEIVRELKQHDDEWRRWFMRYDIEPLALSYDGLSLDPHGCLETVLDMLGMDRGLASSVAVKTAKLADQQSLEWAERFQKDCPEL